MSMYNSNFCCELVLVLSKVPSKRCRAGLHIDTKKKGAEIPGKSDGTVYRRVWLMPCPNLGQTSNSQKGTIAVGPRVGKYHS